VWNKPANCWDSTGKGFIGSWSVRWRGAWPKRELDGVEHMEMDEKSFGRGHDYVSVLTDIDGARGLEMSRGRDEAAANLLWSALSGEQRCNVKAVAMDFWPALANSGGRHVPEAEIVHQCFHITNTSMRR
jgi:transposase